MKQTLITLTSAALFGFASSSLAAGGGKIAMPGLTKGDAIPARAKKDGRARGAIGSAPASTTGTASTKGSSQAREERTTDNENYGLKDNPSVNRN